MNNLFKKYRPHLISLAVLLLTLSGVFFRDALFNHAYALTETESSAWSTGLSYRTRFENAHQTDLSSKRSAILLRLRPEIRYTLDSELSFSLVPQFSKIYGQSIYQPTSSTLGFDLLTSGNVNDPNFLIHEGYVVYQPHFLSDQVVFKLGRFVFNYGDELVLGALDWNNIGRSFDAFQMKFKFDATQWMDLFASKLLDGGSAGKSSVDLYGMYHHYDLGRYLKEVEPYLLYRRDATVPARPVHLAAVGLRAASKFDGFDYRFEWTKEFGNQLNRPTHAYQVDAELGCDLLQDENHKSIWRAAVEGFYADSDYQQWYPTAHKWLGFADVLSRRNVEGWSLHTDVQAATDLKLKLDYHQFYRSSRRDTAYAYSGSKIGTITGSQSRMLGSEIDVTGTYSLRKDMKLVLGYSYFKALDNIKSQTHTKNPVFYYVQTEIKI